MFARSRRLPALLVLWTWMLSVLFVFVQALAAPPALALTPTVTPPVNMPDLLITSMRIELETGGSCSYSSTNLGLRVTVRNQGGVAAGPFEVDANGVRKPVGGGLAAGATTSLWFNSYKYGSPNVVTADATALVAESNEGNNTLSQMVPIPTLPPTCTPTPLASRTPTPLPSRTPTPTGHPTMPDLVIQSVWISVERMESCNYTPILGVHAAIRNQGGVAAGPFEVEVNGVRKLVSAGLGAGQVVSLWFTGYQTGVNTVVADPSNMVVEGNESNNTFAGPLPIPSLPPPCTLTPTPRTPTGTPTATPSAPAPFLTVESSLSSVWVGSTLTVRANSNLGLVGYTLTVIDASTGLEQDQTNPIFTPARPGTITVGSGPVSWTLMAVRPGTVAFRVNAYGEFQDAACGGCWRFISLNASTGRVQAVDGPTRTPSPSVTPTRIAGDLGWQTISGRVWYSSYDMIIPLAGATVSCSHFSYVPRTTCSGTTTTAADGSFTFGSVFLHDTDRITVLASAPGYQSQSMQRSGLDTYRNPTFSILLQPDLVPTVTRTVTPLPSACQVTYRIISQWSTGFTAEVVIKNTGASAVSGWALGWSFANGQQISSMWSASYAQSGASVTASNPSWNGTIPAGGTVSFGFQASHTGTNAVPASFTLNGAPCTT